MPGSEPENAWICANTHHGDGPVVRIREMFTGSPRDESDRVTKSGPFRAAYLLDQ